MTIWLKAYVTLGVLLPLLLIIELFTMDSSNPIAIAIERAIPYILWIGCILGIVTVTVALIHSIWFGDLLE